MRILSLNLWHGEQQAELRDFLIAHVDETDLFCFQEANGNEVEAMLSEIFSEDAFKTVSTEKAAEPIGHYRLVTAVKNKYLITNSFELLDNSDKETGKALLAEIEVDGRRIRVVNIHGVPRPGHKLDTEGRLQQSKELIDAAGDRASILCGDFNLLPETESIRLLTSAGYKNLIEKYTILTTRNRFAWELHPEDKQLFADYIFTSPDIRVVDFSVPQVEVSDHLPMLLEIGCGT